MEETGQNVVMFSRSASIAAAACCVVFIVVGVLGNLITVLALARCAKLRNATTAFVISLGTADLLFCAINLPLTASRYIHEGWVHGETLCRLFPFFFYGNVAASLMSMVAITVNRYILINHYHLYDRIYRRRYIALMIALYWTFSFSIMMPPLFQLWGRLGYHTETFSCTILPLDGRSPKKFLFVFGFVLPCLAITLSYSCIFYKVYRSRQKVTSHSAPSSPASPLTSPGSLLSSDEVRLTRLMLIIFCSFLVCFLPLMIVNVFDSDISYPSIHVVASIFAWMSSCINPIIYAVINRQYRQAYYNLLCPSRLRSGSVGANRSSASKSNGSYGSKTVMSEIFAFNNGANKNGTNQTVVYTKEQPSLQEVAL